MWFLIRHWIARAPIFAQISRARVTLTTCVRTEGIRKDTGHIWSPTIFYISSSSNFLITNSQLIFLLPSAAGSWEKIFGIGLKLTELRAKTVCPYMGGGPYFDLIMATECPKYNIFWWNLFYMLDRHKLHIIAKYQLSNYWNGHLRPKKPLKIHKTGDISVCDKAKTGLAQKPKAFSFLVRLRWNLADLLETYFRP